MSNTPRGIGHWRRTKPPRLTHEVLSKRPDGFEGGPTKHTSYTAAMKYVDYLMRGGALEATVRVIQRKDKT